MLLHGYTLDTMPGMLMNLTCMAGSMIAKASAQPVSRALYVSCLLQMDTDRYIFEYVQWQCTQKDLMRLSSCRMQPL